MNRGFYTIMCAQFLSSLADNALLIAAIALLTSINAPDWMTPLLTLFFVVSYVCLAAWVGIFADSMPKGRVMFLTNFVKAVGCLLMLFGGHPLLAYAIVGVGAAAYSPAKYGILTELLPPQKLVVANGWIEGLTVGSIILGVVLGGVLIKPEIAQSILDLFHLDALGLSSFAEAAIFAIAFVYLAASAVNLAIPDTGVRYPPQKFDPVDSIKGFGVTERYSAGLRKKQEAYRAVSLDYNLFGIKTQALLSILGSMVQMAAFLYCLYLLWSGKILYGTMTLFLTQGTKLTSSFNALVKTVPTFLSASVSANRIRELTELAPEPVLPQSGELLEEAADGVSVVMEEMSLAYEGERWVLSGVTFRAEPGEIVALIGPSGGGKTTMIRTMLGLIAPGRGRAFLRGRDGREVAMNAALRGCFSYVPQGNTMISGTVAENLRMVAPSASDEELERALRAACAWEFVEQMPDGLQAVVGERGHGLSEGQAQRIAIARALLRDAPVLLLDEATSALDVATERRVLRSLIQSHPNKTCIVTTHRPTVIGLCERVYQVGGGTVRELGKQEAQALAMEF